MHGLMDKIDRRVASGRTGASRRDRGAVATIVAACFGAMVILGSAALSIDVGSLMFEKRQLQGGADSASLALAQLCAQSPAQCVSASMTAAMSPGVSIRTLNNSTANDGRNGYVPNTAISANGACRSATVTGSDLPICGASAITNISECPPLAPDLPPTVKYVEVHAQTEMPNGSTVLPPFIAQAIGAGGSSLRACARAAWGPGKPGPGTLPFTISACEWDKAGGNIDGSGAGAWNPPPYPSVNAWPPPTAEIILSINKPNGNKNPLPCPNWQGHDQPGGFGFLETVPGNDCLARTFGDGNWYHTDNGASVACDLSTLVGTVVTIPIFSCTLDNITPGGGPPPSADGCFDSANGTHAYYYAQGYAKFFLSGYDATTTSGIPNKVKSVLTGNFPPCAGGYSCISGWFVKGVGGGEIGDGTNSFGFTSVAVGG